ncbi:nucleotidyltransferase family protein [candidate division KSB1 bacterium]|nr:nucleotidyltransferase family protein [candidate division KSB1 bacterium]
MNKNLLKRVKDFSSKADWIEAFCQRWKIQEFSFFGSILRDDFQPQSDIDVLVSFSPDAKWSLFDIIDMKDELQQILGRNVDIVEKDAVRNPFRKESIMSSREVVYAA